MQVGIEVERWNKCTCQSYSPAHPAKCHTHRANILATLCNISQVTSGITRITHCQYTTKHVNAFRTTTGLIIPTVIARTQSSWVGSYYERDAVGVYRRAARLDSLPAKLRHLLACSESLPSQLLGRPTTNSSAFCNNSPNDLSTQSQISEYTTCIIKHRGHRAAVYFKSLVPRCHELPNPINLIIALPESEFLFPATSSNRVEEIPGMREIHCERHNLKLPNPKP